VLAKYPPHEGAPQNLAHLLPNDPAGDSASSQRLDVAQHASDSASGFGC